METLDMHDHVGRGSAISWLGCGISGLGYVLFLVTFTSFGLLPALATVVAGFVIAVVGGLRAALNGGARSSLQRIALPTPARDERGPGAEPDAFQGNGPMGAGNTLGRDDEPPASVSCLLAALPSVLALVMMGITAWVLMHMGRQ